MNREKLEKFLLDNQCEIVGIRYNDYFYNVDNIVEYNIEFDDEPVLCAYELDYDSIDDNRIITETMFTMKDLLSAKLEFYKHTKIEF